MKVKIIEGYINKYNFNKDCCNSNSELNKVEDELNDFLSQHNYADIQIIDIKVNTYTAHRRNNTPYDDDVKIIYTILYKELD